MKGTKKPPSTWLSLSDVNQLGRPGEAAASPALNGTAAETTSRKTGRHVNACICLDDG
jgi:hypothetical protein